MTDEWPEGPQGPGRAKPDGCCDTPVPSVHRGRRNLIAHDAVSAPASLSMTDIKILGRSHADLTDEIVHLGADRQSLRLAITLAVKELDSPNWHVRTPNVGGVLADLRRALED